jgi:type III restriction enzyme
MSQAKFVFDPNQDYQLKAIASIVDIFSGQVKLQPHTNFGLQPNVDSQEKHKQTELVDFNIVPNTPLIISKADIAQSVHSIQTQNSVPLSPTEFNSNGQLELKDSTNFTIEMETGTGKTYVYLRTIFELNKLYGWQKFIIVVPRIAIKEGVVKSYQQMSDHFAEVFNIPRVNFRQWNSKKRGIGRQFASSDCIEIMVLNIDAFTRSNTIFNQQSDSGRPLSFIAKTSPILILDEPQNLESQKRRQAIASLNPLFSLRYSATHKEIINLMYKLSPVEAYNMNLVKQIEVDSVLTSSSNSLRLMQLGHSSKNSPIAKLEIDSSEQPGLQRKIITVQVGSELADYTNNPAYSDYIVDTIDTEQKILSFTSGEQLTLGVADESIKMQIMQTQIDQTVRNHFEKQLRLNDSNIKVLSLFFIDKVANYINNGPLAVMFEEAYNKYAKRSQYAGLFNQPASKVHGGYFSIDNRGNAIDSKDSAEGATANDVNTVSAYDRILKQKEKLISFSEPLCFLFSHTALREGWDNPNVFQICTLNESVSTMRKRQEIGRGLRLAVNTNGHRIFDRKVNILTVIANESYDEFASKLQQEIEQDTGTKFAKSNIKKKPKKDRVNVKINKNLTNNKEFLELWNRISAKTKYTVNFNDNELIELASKNLAEQIVSKAKIKVYKSLLGITEKQVKATVISEFAGSSISQNSNFDILKIVQNLTQLKRETIFKIISESDTLEKFNYSPQNYIEAVVMAIEQAEFSLLVDGIKYEEVGENWAISLFDNEEVEQALASAYYEPEDTDKTSLNFVPIDSGVENSYAEALDKNSNVKFYFKLPRGFYVATPIGKYRPDWAVLFYDDSKVYFVSETKGVSNINDPNLKPLEKAKIIYGSKHFSSLNDPVKFIAPTDSFSDTIGKLSHNN